MSEKYHTRRETMADQIEQDKQYQAIQTLLDLGICKKVSDLELFHGRAGDGNEWRVKPDYNNAGNSTGNHNVNKVPALNTSDDYHVAKEFAEERSLRDGGNPEVQRIVSNDPDAMILCSGMKDLNNNDKKKACKAISLLCPGVMTGAPISFEHRHDLDGIKPEDFTRNEYDLMFSSEIPNIQKRTGLDEDLIVHVGSAINTKKILELGHIAKLCDAFLANKQTIPSGDDTLGDLPISQEYLANFFRSAHIVGARVLTDSKTLGKDIYNTLIFDLQKINTPDAYEKKAKPRNRYFGQIAVKMQGEGGKSNSSLLQTLKSNLYIKPREIVQIAKQTPGFENVFEEDCGNWEGFKLGEHVETVLKLFDDNYADFMPDSTLPIIRLALLVHDIGKPEAVKNYDKKNQRKYNIKNAIKFMEQNNIDKKTQDLIVSMIGEGMDITSSMIKGNYNVALKWKMEQFCEEIAKKYLGEERVSKDAIFGFKCILQILQTCDSAAYTTRAITRANNGVKYRNAGSFDDSFQEYTGFTRNRAVLKQDLAEKLL